MKPVKCPTCDLVWNIMDNAPAQFTCPRCLSLLNNPYTAQSAATSTPQGTTRPPPLPVMPLERQVTRDTHASKVGMWVVLAIALVGLGILFSAGMTGANWLAILFIGFLVIMVAAIVAVFVGYKYNASLPKPVQPVPAIDLRSGAYSGTSSVLDYQRPLQSPRKLSPSAFLGQTVGGIILGILGSVAFAFIFGNIGNGEAAGFAIFLAPALGIALLFLPRVRGLGLGLILALPAAFLLLLGFCAILMTGSRFH
jgi:hypothetical protein